MEDFFSWAGAALGALFVVAVAVAWWEHLVRSSRPPAPPEAVLPRVVNVDVQLDALPAAAMPAPIAPGTPGAPGMPPASDAAQRRAALDGAMSRMVRAGFENSTWAATAPMLLDAPAELPKPDTAPKPARA